MSVGVSTEIVVWIAALVSFIIVVTIWGLYRLISFLRGHSQVDRLEATESQGSTSPLSIQLNGFPSLIKDAGFEATSTKEVARPHPPSESQSNSNLEHQGKVPSGKQITQRNRYIDYKNTLDNKSHDKILHESLERSLNSSKSVKSRIGEMKSNGSRRSTGFEPTLGTVKPFSRGGRKNNFLELLDRLNAIDAESEQELQEREEKKKKAAYTASSAGIEADPSDETASQTFIGKEPTSRPDPGSIHLSLIRSMEPDTDNQETQS